MSEGAAGFCGVRQCRNGKIVLATQGRVTGQSLCEAVWGIKLLHAVANIGFDTTSA